MANNTPEPVKVTLTEMDMMQSVRRNISRSWPCSRTCRCATRSTARVERSAHPVRGVP